MKSQCKTCPISEDDCAEKKAGREPFDGVNNVCSCDPREKAKKASDSAYDIAKSVEEYFARNGGYTYPYVNTSSEKEDNWRQK